jgi:hypothetical protein
MCFIILECSSEYPSVCKSKLAFSGPLIPLPVALIKIAITVKVTATSISLSLHVDTALIDIAIRILNLSWPRYNDSIIELTIDDD